MMNMMDLRYLVVSATIGNFRRAAESLGLSASTVSRRITHLEDELGVTIFERGRFGIRLTTGGHAVMAHVRRVLADFDALSSAGNWNGSGRTGEIRLGVRMPPVGEPLLTLLRDWRERYPDVGLVISEGNERDIQVGLSRRHLDVALMTKHTLWPHAVTEPVYRERIVAALPQNHPLAEHRSVNWKLLRNETILVQGWDESQSARELYASFMGSGIRFRTHPASKQSILALVGAEFGITLATTSQSEVRFPGVVYRPIEEENAWIEIDLAWCADAEDPAVGRFVAFMRDEARLRHLF